MANERGSCFLHGVKLSEDEREKVKTMLQTMTMLPRPAPPQLTTDEQARIERIKKLMELEDGFPICTVKFLLGIIDKLKA